MRIVLTAAMVACACGGATQQQPVTLEAPHASDAADAGASIVDAAATPPDAARATIPVCPPRYAQNAPTCARGDDPGPCAYGERTCRCQTTVQCGGMYRPPLPPQWTCSAPPPPCGPAGGACTGSATCYPGPCPCGAQLQCVGGTWVARVVPCPP